MVAVKMAALPWQILSPNIWGFGSLYRKASKFEEKVGLDDKCGMAQVSVYDGVFLYLV